MSPRSNGDVRMTAVLRRVEHVAVSEASGYELNPRYFWLTREYSLWLECGHVQVRARFPGDGGPAPETLSPPLPRRVRCAECPPAPSTGRARKRAPEPVFDPVTGRLVAALCTAAPALEDRLLAWADRHGRYLPEGAGRSRAYAAMAVTAIDTYLPDTRNAHVPAVRDAVTRWAAHPTSERRVEIRRATRRLYGTQHRDGDWYAHRGIIDAAKLTSPWPHNAEAVLTCPTWDTATRSQFYNRLWAIRHDHDTARDREAAAFLADDGDRVRQHSREANTLRDALTHAVQHEQPVLAAQHVALAVRMLSAYHNALNTGGEPASGGGGTPLPTADTNRKGNR